MGSLDPLNRSADASAGALEKAFSPAARAFDRRWWGALALVLALGAASRISLCAEYLARTPLAECPLVDAKVYWDWAGRIAAGELISRAPFFSAPLYPYLLGLLRACGGGLGAVYTLQIALDLLTALLLAWIGRWRWGAPAGVLAAALFLLMLEPASFSLRVLSSTIQLPLVCLVWLALLATLRVPSWRRAALSGVALGLLALSYASAVVAVPIVFLWWCVTVRGWAGLRLATATAIAALAIIAPATIHNYLACGEFIPISAQAGVTFAQGNAPQATGLYTPAPGISMDRELQNRDAQRLYQRVTGLPPTWRAVDRFFFRQGWETSISAPLRTLKLLARKVYWFLTGNNYSDIYFPTLELSTGLMPRLRFTPLATAWLIPPALVTLAVWARRPRQHLPELLLFAIPLLTVVAFFYSPRYRFPALPVIVVACTGTLWHAARCRTNWRWSIAAVLSVGAALGLAVINKRADFDTPQIALFQDRLGGALFLQGRYTEAREHFRIAVRLRPEHAVLQKNLATALLQCGDMPGALRHFQRALELDPTLLDAHKYVAQILCAGGDLVGGITALRRAHDMAPDDADVANNLAWYLATTPDLPPDDRDNAVRLAQQAATATRRQDPGVLDTLAAARAATGDFAGAVETLEQALALAPQGELSVQLRQRLALYQAGRPYLAPAAPAPR